MKQVIIVRDDLGMSRGKAVAQGAHVSVLAVRQANELLVEDWLGEGGKKITLSVTSREELMELVEAATGLPTATIQDKGYTELDPGTLTAGAIGPAGEEQIDDITGNLPLYD